jgi:glycosyltransferase involved in cell wall biosynthesis
MGDSTISIVIPTKNEENYLVRTLAQFADCLEQFDLEIIVSDANSTDRTPEIVREYEKSTNGRIRLVQRPGKQNIAIGRNAGAEAAKGGILFHMDADVMIPNKERFFSKIRTAFQNPKTVAATVPLWIYPEESGFVDKCYHLFMNSVIRLSFVFGVYLAKGECQFVRRNTFEEIEGYNEKLIAGEDCNLFFRLHKEGRVVYLPSLCVHHSPRRFREYGYFKVSMIYLREGLSLLFLRRSYVEEWKPIR